MEPGDSVSRAGARPSGDAAPPLRQLVIVARDRPDLYEQLSRQFAGDSNVQVIVDRPAGDDEPSHPRRSNRRQANMQVLAKLWLAGYAVVRVE